MDRRQTHAGRVVVLIAALALAACSSGSDSKDPGTDGGDASTDGSTTSAQQVKLVTSLGEILLQLDAAKAPRTVANFLSYLATASSLFSGPVP